MRIAIVEDDQSSAELLQRHLRKFEKEKHEQYEVAMFADGEDLLEGYKKGFDIIFMDIEMCFMNGLTAAEHVRKIDEKVNIIFVTHSAQYAISGYSVNALDYILKPVSYFAFSRLMEKAVKRVTQKDVNYVSIVSKNGFRKLELADIFWIESQGHRLTFHTNTGDYSTTCSSLREIEKMFSNTTLVRCNQGYLLNLAYVDGIEEGYIVIGEKKFMVSRSRKREFMQALTTYLGENLR